MCFWFCLSGSRTCWLLNISPSQNVTGGARWPHSCYSLQSLRAFRSFLPQLWTPVHNTQNTHVNHTTDSKVDSLGQVKAEWAYRSSAMVWASKFKIALWANSFGLIVLTLLQEIWMGLGLNREFSWLCRWHFITSAIQARGENAFWLA